MRRLAILVVLGALLIWVGIPLERAASVVETHSGDSISVPSDLTVKAIHFRATDGINLHGWLVPASATRPTVILVPGFKSDRMSMLPYARFLHSGGFNVVLYDSRGTGESGGKFTLGAGEVNDVLGAIRFVASDPALPSHHVGLLGVSLGAGDVIVAAARDHRVRATVADSAYTDQDAVINAMNQLYIAGPITIPLAPIAAPVIDRLGGVSISSYRPIASIAHIAPRAIFLIHSRHDGNVTTPLSGALQLYQAAPPPTILWIAPYGGHAGALAAQPGEYARRVLAFFRRYLGEQ